jgi:uncharacterized damage-inducible protein DinB
MNANEILVLNLEEVRRRSIKIWRGIPGDKLEWKPDAGAMSGIEMVRHILKGEWAYMQMLRAGKSVDTEDSPFYPQEFTDVSAELEIAEPYRKEFLTLVESYSLEELADRKIDRSDVGYVRTYGDFILRIAYHESVHAGQLQNYLRLMNVARPQIWD